MVISSPTPTLRACASRPMLRSVTFRRPSSTSVRYVRSTSAIVASASCDRPRRCRSSLTAAPNASSSGSGGRGALSALPSPSS
jgi:hypothetical protein